MSGDRRWSTGKIPKGWEIVAPVLDALQEELKEQITAGHDGRRKVEAQWPVHQISWQRTRYIYDLYHRYKRIPKPVYDYCIKNKLIDAALVAKWKKPGYERLCSTHTINPNNYNFGSVSICRVPRYELGPDHPMVEDKFTGCRGCASGRGGRRNIFGNKYGQYLAAIQVSREDRAAKGEEVPTESIWAQDEEEAKFDDAAADSDEEEGNRRKRRRKLQPAVAIEALQKKITDSIPAPAPLEDSDDDEALAPSKQDPAPEAGSKPANEAPAAPAAASDAAPEQKAPAAKEEIAKEEIVKEEDPKADDGKPTTAAAPASSENPPQPAPADEAS
eukprot:gene8945-13848_t